jgi:hypothetical protein
LATRNRTSKSRETTQAGPSQKTTLRNSVRPAASARPLAKSADPAFTKFTTYIRKTTHRSVKTRLVSKEQELSDLVEELLAKWLKENGTFGDH